MPYRLQSYAQVIIITNEMVKLLLITVAFVAAAFGLMAIKLIVKGDARGPMTHIGASEAMRQRGIHCVESMDAIERHNLQTRSHATERIAKSDD